MDGKFIVVGIVFAILWSSAATATKIALESAQPLVIAVTRFLFAGCLMLLITHLLQGRRKPTGREWKQLTVYGLLNVSLYLGIYIIAMQFLGAGIGSLAIAVNPVFISLLSAIFFRYRITGAAIFSLVACSAGVLVAAWPLLQNSTAQPIGIVLLLASMLIYSIAAIYYTRQQWNGLDSLTINGWHTLIGGLFLLPLAAAGFDPAKNNLDGSFWTGTLWLAIPVSIGAVQCWLFLLKKDTIAASYWLYACPVFGFLLAFIFLKEPLTLFTLAGILLVSGGLYVSQKTKKLS